MYDIFYIGPKNDSYQKLKNKILTLRQADTFESANKKCITKFFWCVWDDIIIEDDFTFDYAPDEWSQDVPHVFKNGALYDGVWLVPKKNTIRTKEIEYRFLVSKKEIPIVASTPRPYEIFIIDTMEQYEQALASSKTEMFFGVSSMVDIIDMPDVYFRVSKAEEYNRKENHAWLNDVCGELKYDGLYLFSKHKPVSKKEIEYRHLVYKKEYETIATRASKYPIYTIDTYDDYEHALNTCKTEMFFGTSKGIDILDFDFDIFYTYRGNEFEYERKENHAFKNICNGEEKYNGIFLLSKHKQLSKRELQFRHIVYKKEWNIVASKHKPYDVVFMSYDEEYADENYENLLKKAPHATRVHGVKGIHQAHIAAAKQCSSEMIWIVDADAIIMDDFNFELFVEKWDRETVHVWRSKNPINDLVYGYGGVKLFPRELTINMDTSKPDMTTSITHKFKAMPAISNITAFNTDPFNTWKSAFRECCKLSSKIIDRQRAKETEERLHIWCTVGDDKEFGEYAISGAKAGAAYGSRNKENLEALKKINDFDWLKNYYNEI